MFGLLVSLLALQPQNFLNKTTKVPPSWIHVGKPPQNMTLEFGLLLPQKKYRYIRKIS